MFDLSKMFKNAVINLYRNGTYTVDYAIIEASKLADKNKINATDYEELINYLAEEQEKVMQEVENNTDDTIDSVENIKENAEIIETVEDIEQERNAEDENVVTEVTEQE